MPTVFLCFVLALRSITFIFKVAFFIFLGGTAALTVPATSQPASLFGEFYSNSTIH